MKVHIYKIRLVCSLSQLLVPGMATGTQGDVNNGFPDTKHTIKVIMQTR